MLEDSLLARFAADEVPETGESLVGARLERVAVGTRVD